MHRSLVAALLALAPATAYAAEPPPQKHDETEEAQKALAESQAQTTPALGRGPAYQPSIWPWILGGTGIAAIATGGGFMLVSLSDRGKSNDFSGLASHSTNENEKAQLESSASQKKKSANTEMTVGIVAAGVGGALLVTAIVWAILDHPPESEKSAQARVSPTADGLRVVF
jgi:hypothetical protein